MCGFGRTGEWFAWQGIDGGVTPDLVTFAKGVNSGYVPAGGVLISESIANAFESQVFPGGLTYSGHPLAMASIVGSIDAMTKEKVIENARAIGTDHLAPGLAELAEKHPVIGDVRGLGVFWALDLVDDRESRQPVSGGVILQLKKALMERGLLPFTADNRIHVVPPCIVTPDEVAQALSIYDEAFTEVEAAL
jgi:taurine--2-oxoglutarate transaminase